MEKGEIACNEQFPQCFLPAWGTNFLLFPLNLTLLSANSLILSKICYLGKGYCIAKSVDSCQAVQSLPNLIAVSEFCLCLKTRLLPN